jgi:hypothetical protein
MYEAKQLVVKSGWMGDEIVRVYKAPVEKIRVIPPDSTGWIKDVLETYRGVVGGAGSQ